jgi:hypothetical protein
MNVYDEIESNFRGLVGGMLNQFDIRFAGVERAAVTVSAFFEGRGMRLGFCEDFKYKDSYYMVGPLDAPLSTHDLVAQTGGWSPISDYLSGFGKSILAAHRELNYDEFKPHAYFVELLVRELEARFDELLASRAKGDVEKQGS